MDKNVRAIVVYGFLMKYIVKKTYPENLKKKMWEPFECSQVNSTANPAKLGAYVFLNYFIKNP